MPAFSYARNACSEVSTRRLSRKQRSHQSAAHAVRHVAFQAPLVSFKVVKIVAKETGRVETYDVIVIGGGSAAFDAAVAAREAGAERVVMLEKAPESEYGGEDRHSRNGLPFVHWGAP